MLDPPGLGLGVEAFGIAPDAFLDRRVDKDLEKGGGAGQLAHHPPLGAERRDERADHDQPGLGHQLGDLAHAADVLDPVDVGKAEIAVEPVPHIVAVEQHRMPAAGQQLLLDQIGDRRFAGPRQPGQPQHRRGFGL